MLGARGPWRKMREIGKGAFGLVYLVQRGNDERRRAFVIELHQRCRR